MIELSSRERDVYEYLRDCINRDGYAPSVRDIAAALSIKSTSTVHSYLSKLKQKGYIQKGQGKSRALTLVSSDDEGDRMVKVPLLGKVTAGVPITAVENYDGYIDFPAVMMRSDAELFALRVSGESMIDAGILDGDIVVVERCSYADDGTIVIAMIEDEATVKKIYHDNNRIRLQPCNPTMSPIFADNVTLLGKIVANYRFY